MCDTTDALKRFLKNNNIYVKTKLSSMLNITKKIKYCRPLLLNLYVDDTE